MNPAEAAGRRAGREAALQMLYQCEVGRTAPVEAIATYWPSREQAIDECYQEFANGLLRGTVAKQAEIDRLLAEHAQNWRVERMNVLDRLVLRLSIFELLTEPATPAGVVINEALELARRFSGEESVGFVNGILDAVRKTLGRA